MHISPVHIEKNRINRNYNVLLFLLPALVFGVILSLYAFTNFTFSNKASQESSQVVLGEDSGLDKQDQTIPK